MALGGYKFAGYKCTKPSGATDAQWALLIHKTRLKAFMAANTLAGDIWEFDWSNGAIAFETYGNVIYSLTADGLNLVSFFKHNSEGKYYMIASLFSFFCSSTQAYSTLWLSSPASGPTINAYYSASSGYWKIFYKQLFHAVSYDRFSTDCLVKTTAQSDNYPSKAICLVPIGGFCTSAATNLTVSMDANNSYGSMTSFCAGYALKNKDIISFAIDSLSRSEARYYIKTSLVGFDSLTLSSPNDTANIYGISFTYGNSNVYDISYVPQGSQYPVSPYSETLKDNFTRYVENGKWSVIGLGKTKKAFFSGSPESIPYESVEFTAGCSRNDAPFLNSDGICSKGAFNIDLISANSYYNNTAYSMMNTAANGNYLLVYRSSDTVSGITSIVYSQVNYYIGWDPSNPDITSEDAWTAYDGT